MSARPLHWLIALCAAAGITAAGVAATRVAATRDDAPDAMHVQAPARAVSPDAQRPARTAPGCERCHGELELLRQQTQSLGRARQLLVPDSVVLGSAHAQMLCVDCHSGFARFPHDTLRSATASCASCHAPQDTLWSRGAHATADDPVPCASCHTVHAVVAADSVQPGHSAPKLNAPCISCHEADALAEHDPHAQNVSCAGCHAAHDTRASSDSASWLAPARQVQTCAGCHDSTAAVWRQDIHGDTTLQQLHAAADSAEGPVLCTSCHTGHRMLAVEDSLFRVESVARCQACHEKAASTFFGSYHGKATALGSRVSASCADCHGAHEILPDTFPASHVAQANLVETCSACHEHARPKFVQYDSHPNPFDRSRNSWIFYSFWLMNGLLIFVLVVFGAHTLLWWIRLWLDRRRGVSHGHGGAA